MNTMNQDK